MSHSAMRLYMQTQEHPGVASLYLFDLTLLFCKSNNWQ